MIKHYESVHTDQNNSNKAEITTLVGLALASAAVGGITGFYHAKGENISSETLEKIIMATPVISSAALGTYIGLQDIKQCAPGEKIILPIFGAGMYGTVSGILFLAGYGAGQLIGRKG